MELNKEQLAKAQEAKLTGEELADEELDVVSGGAGQWEECTNIDTKNPCCPYCHVPLEYRPNGRPAIFLDGRGKLCDDFKCANPACWNDTKHYYRVWEGDRWFEGYEWLDEYK